MAEGIGDVAALPALITRTAVAFGAEVFAPYIVRAGGWPRLKQPGQLERFCYLAGSHREIDAVVVVVDLDDGCAVEERNAVSDRLLAIEAQLNVPVRLTFCIREFETWLLEGIDAIRNRSPEITWQADAPQNPTSVRGAKEAFERMIGSKYRESIDQEKFSRRIDPASLYRISRSFRKFCKDVCGIPYDVLDLM